MYKAEASVRVSAPPQQVWDYVSNYQNFDQFMTHVEKVSKVNGETSEWKLKGPLGIPVGWKAVTTQWQPPNYLAWQSLEGSVKTQGHIRVEPDTRGSRVTVYMEYVPPGGAIGEVFAAIFKNPQKMLEEDLENLAEIASGWPRQEVRNQP